VTAVAASSRRLATAQRYLSVPVLATGLLFFVLYWKPFTTLLNDWWVNPDAQHGLLLAPIALYLAWRSGIATNARPQRGLGIAVLVAAVVLRYLSGLAAELFTMRFSMLLGAAALVVYAYGFRQLLRWWLPALLLLLSVPLPTVVLNSLAFPLQLQASKMGAALLASRHVPVLLAGNVIHLPGQALFVTEACSGLRSLTALIALGLLIGGIFLTSPWTRTLVLLAAIPVAMFLNGIRIFLTGFLVYFVDPKLGEGFMHYSEGWVIFVVAFAILGAFSWLLARIEQTRRRHRAAEGA